MAQEDSYTDREYIRFWDWKKIIHADPAYWREFIPYYKAKISRIYYKGIHYCGWCGIEMPKEKYHGNRALCNRCKTKWDVGNKQGNRQQPSPGLS